MAPWVLTIASACGATQDDVGPGDHGSAGGSGGGGTGGATSLSIEELAEKTHNCGPIPDLPEGGTTGSMTLQVAVEDEQGVAVLNVPLALSGDTEATRRTNILGHATFRVDPGDYRITYEGSDCTLTPVEELLSGLSSDRVVTFRAAGGGCLYESVVEANPGRYNAGIERVGKAALRVQREVDEAGGVRRIELIMSTGSNPQSCDLMIGGHQAFETFTTAEIGGLGDDPPIEQEIITTTIYLGSEVLIHTLEIEAGLDELARAEAQLIALRSARSLSAEDIEAFVAQP